MLAMVFSLEFKIALLSSMQSLNLNLSLSVQALFTR